MKNRIQRVFMIALAAALAWTVIHAAAQKKGPKAGGKKGRDDALYESNSAIIVVTGMRLDENPDNYTKDLSMAEGATVMVSAPGGAAREKKTETFINSGRKGGGPEKYFTADFSIDLGTTYTIAMRFKDGTALEIKDYFIPREWKTHFYFHSTNGTKSPASILRTVEDPKTKLRCCVWAVYPLENYLKLGGRQIQ